MSFPEQPDAPAFPDSAPKTPSSGVREPILDDPLFDPNKRPGTGSETVPEPQKKG